MAPGFGNKYVNYSVWDNKLPAIPAISTVAAVAVTTVAIAATVAAVVIPAWL
ncbi:hypothetical protein KSZ_67530 [Dictyobacter formicarum]|uniref:Uncharacterized protein n=1 Tax=Dictyobacter formicarum TaxID=2778368 RepID=A0ABQ3VS98_9CHLR|nr:hypothetical protein KSZ_67530 [Dictyobacter formicarum]